MLRGGTGGRAARVTGQIVELGEVHCLPDGDPTTILTFHPIPSNPTTDRKGTGRLGGWMTRDVSGGDPVHMHTIPNRRLHRGFRGEQG